MISRIRPIPPYHTGTLKGLRGVPSPFFILNISRPLGNPEDKQKSQKHLREEEILRQWGGKIIRRLLLKAGIPLLTIEECREPARIICFKVQIDCSLVFKQVIYSSVK